MAAASGLKNKQDGNVFVKSCIVKRNNSSGGGEGEGGGI